MGEVSKRIEELEQLVLFHEGSWNTEQRLKILDKIREIKELDSHNADVLFLEGMYYWSDDRPEDALPIFKQILKEHPNSPRAEVAKEFAEIIGDVERHTPSSQNSSGFLSKIPCEWILGIKLVIVLIFICSIFSSKIFSVHDNKILTIKDTYNFETLKINSRSEYSFLSKQEIFDIRKNYVQDSLFARKNYEPSEREFGSIVDNKPWWGSIKCQPVDYSGNYYEFTRGKSVQSLKINNPNILIGLDNLVIPRDTEENTDFCNSEYSNFIPDSLKYNKKNNLFIVEYKVPRSFLDMRAKLSGKKVRFPIQLSGLNALDFGYKYVYAFDTQNIQMYDYHDNITQRIGEFKDYIHLGNSCGYAGGCNNISPVQYDKMITITDLPAEINLKLWKAEPLNKYLKGNIYYRIIFSEL